jgi:hypothetical protein
MPAPQRVPREPSAGRVAAGLTGGVFVVAIAMAVLLIGGWLLARGVGDAVCSSYNPLSNDFCDEWHYDPPPAERFPLPAGWSVAWQELSCGSGGCPTRVFVLTAGEDIAEPVSAYAAGLRGMGWEVQRRSDPDLYFVGRSGELVVSIEPADTELTTAPARFRSKGHVKVAFSLESEAALVFE